MNKEKVRHDSTLGGDAVKLTLSRAFTLVINLVATMLISRYRTTEEYGTYSQLLLVISLFSTIFLLGLPNSINYFLSRANSVDEENGFLSNYYTLTTALSLVLGFSLVVASGLVVDYFANACIADYKFFLLLYPWATITMHSIDNVMVVYKRINTLIAFKAIYSVLLVGIVIVNHVLEHSFTQYMIGFTALNIGAGVCTIILANDPKHHLLPRINKKTINRILVFSIPIGISTLVGTLNAEIDKLYIGYVADTEKLAIYTNAAQELPINIIASSVCAIMIPKIVSMVKEGLVQKAIDKWKTSVELSFIVICFMVCGVVVYSKEVMTILYSEKYLPGETVFRVYSFTLLLRVTYFGMFLNAFGKPKYILASSLISLAFNAIFNPLFYSFFGLVGPAISTVLAILVMQFSQLLMSSKLLHRPIHMVFPFGKLIGVTCISVIIGIAFGFIKRLIPLENYFGEIMESVLLGFVWGGVYFLIYKKRIVCLWNELQ